MTPLAVYRLIRTVRSKSDEGNVLVLALVAALVLTLGMAALASRGGLGAFGAAFQSKNREARDHAEWAISQFIDTLNQPENRYVLVGGDGNTFASSDNSLRNPCTMYSSSTLLPTGATTPSALSGNIANFKPAIDKSRNSSSWQNFKAGDSTSQYLVESVEYFDESRNSYTPTQTIGGVTQEHPTRVLIKAGNSRGLVRVTIQARVTRNGRTSYARVARELEVVPKCCFRSFGANQYYGAYWGRDNRICTVGDPKGGGTGIFAFKGTGGSKNDLNIIGEDGKQISSAVCWAGSDDGGATDLTGTPNSNCGSSTNGLTLGSDVSLTAQKFDLVLPKLEFNKSGALPLLSGLPTGAAVTGWGLADGAARGTLNTLYPNASPGSWVLNDADDTVWIAGYPEKTINPNSSSDALIWYQAARSVFESTTSVSNAETPLAISATNKSLSTSKDYIYYDAVTDKRVELCNINGGKVDESSCEPMPCYTLQGSGGNGPSPYAQANCNLTYLTSGNHQVFVDTTNASINFFFEGNGDPNNGATKGEYMGGGGNTKFINVHCSSLSTASNPCTSPITWDQFKLECLSSGSTADPRCSTSGVTNRPYNTGDLFNIYTLGTGSFNLNGSAAGSGYNLYAPNASVRLVGGGNQNPNFMGRLWAGTITLAGSVTINTLSSLPGFCKGSTCPTDSLPIYDMKVRSYTQASGF